MAPGFAPQLRKVNLDRRVAAAGLPHGAGQADPAAVSSAPTGKPIAETYVSIIGWEAANRFSPRTTRTNRKCRIHRYPNKADANGDWEWTSAPDDSGEAANQPKGFTTPEIEIAGGAPARTIVLKAKAMQGITGRVTDAATGKPIPSFAVMPYRVPQRLSASERNHAERGKGRPINFDATRTTTRCAADRSKGLSLADRAGVSRRRRRGTHAGFPLTTEPAGHGRRRSTPPASPLRRRKWSWQRPPKTANFRFDEPQPRDDSRRQRGASRFPIPANRSS